MEQSVLSCGCGARLKIPATVPAGKQVKCPKCSSVLTVPEPGEIVFLGPEPVATTDAPSSDGPQRKACPFCGESILAEAIKCRHCGEFLDPARAPRPAGKAIAAASATEPNPAEYFVAIVLAPIGLIVGAFWAARRQPKARKMFQVSAASCVILGVSGSLVWRHFIDPPKEVVFSGKPVDVPPTPATVPRFPNGQGGGQGGVPSAPADSGAASVDLEGQTPEIQKAMKANVRIDTGRGSGSGVIVGRDKDDVLILTNHHVVDHKFAESNGDDAEPVDSIGTMRVTYYNDQGNPGKVVWLAPYEIDLAIVRAAAPKDIEPVPWKFDGRVLAGQRVFAVGNPVGLGWTYTQGVVSALRPTKFGKVDVPIIQTDVSITFGNSGGGLYTEKGELIGINSSIVDPRLGSRLGFSIRPTVLNALKPPPLFAPAAPAKK